MDNRKIGILTFHFAVNPGSVLQAYGLWKTINSFETNIDCDIINYQGTSYRRWFMGFPKKVSIRNCILQVYLIHSYLKYQRFWKKIAGAVSPRHWIDEDGLKHLKGYDCIVAGSDQIWNTKLWNKESTGKKSFLYFLSFCPNVVKISYAASIGSHDFPEEDKNTIKRFLDDFRYISVREPEAQDAIENLTGKRPELVIDPSLLLEKKHYETLAIHPSIKEKYLFLYLRHKNSEVVSYARQMAQAKNLKIVECHGGVSKIYKNDKTIGFPDPFEWLGWIMNAEYVFTDSFHGCAFCINLNKPFFAKISSANSQMSSRIYHILDRYGLKNRLIEDGEDVQTKCDIDFSQSNKLLIQDREKSIGYLRKVLDIK